MEQDNMKYCQQAIAMLSFTFKRISVQAIQLVFTSKDRNFTAAFRELNIIQQMQALHGHEAIPPTVKVFLKNDRRNKKPQLTDLRLHGEISALPEMNSKPQTMATPIIVIDDSDEEDNNDAIQHETCLICYEEYPPNENIHQCDAGEDHYVCTGCIRRHVSEQVDGKGKANFKCIAHLDCPFEYSEAFLDQMLTPKLKKRAMSLLFRENVKEALDNIWTCPNCTYQGWLEEDYPWIQCGGCDNKYCTRCNEPFHENKTCEQVRGEKERLKDPRVRAQEAMTAAVKRHCPDCNKEFTKLDGCNKMTCHCGPGEGTARHVYSCYLCGSKLDSNRPYQHFCNCRANACSCGKKCRLWTSTPQMEEIDRKRRREAGLKILEEAGITDQNVIEEVLFSPGAKKPADAPRRNAHVVPPPILRQPRYAVHAPQPPQPPRDVEEEIRGVQQDIARMDIARRAWGF